MAAHSAPRPIVLDTNALSDAGFLYFLGRYRRPKILPAFALLEIGRLYHARRWTPHRLLSLLGHHGIDVEPLGPPEALSAAWREIPEDDWRRHMGDALIAAHVSADRVLVTENTRDFRHLPADRVLTPAEAMRRWA